MTRNQKLFNKLQAGLLKHKKAYYIQDSPLISDQEYDLLERQSFALAKKLGYRADPWEGPTPEEADHVHWMVGYKEGNPFDKN